MQLGQCRLLKQTALKVYTCYNAEASAYNTVTLYCFTDELVEELASLRIGKICQPLAQLSRRAGKQSQGTRGVY